MSISNRQTERETDKIIGEALKTGYFPSNQSITYRLYKWQQDHTPGTPTFKLKNFESRQQSSSKLYNESMESIHTDLCDIYEETKDQVNRLLTNFDYNDTERRKLMHELNKLSGEIDDLVLVAKNTDGYTEAFSDTFNSFANVDPAETTANVDLQSGQVILQELKSSFEKIDISNAIGEAKCNNIDLTSVNLEPTNNCFDDNINTAWRMKVSSPKVTEVMVYLDIKFSSIPCKINQIVFNSHSPKATIIQVYTSTDGSSWESFSGQKPRLVTNQICWNFSEVEATHVRFVLIKKEPDDYLEGQFNYYFGSKNISLYSVRYVEEDVFVTQTHETKREQISRVSLDVEEECPSGTEIEYYIAPVLEGSDELIYQPISPLSDMTPENPKVLDLSTISTTSSVITNPKNDSYYSRGVEFHKIYTTEHLPVDNSEKLYRGINQWKREHMLFIPPDEVAVYTWDYNPSLYDWSKFQKTKLDYANGAETKMLNEDDVFTSYIDIFESAGISAALVVPDPTNADPNLLDVPFINGKTKYNKSYRGNYLLYTTNLYIENSLSPITATLESRGCKIKVYLNRAEVQPSNFVYDVYEKRDYSYQFVPGWNTLQFVIYKHVNDDANPQTNPKSEPLYVHPHLDQVLAPFLNNDKAKIRAEVFPLTKVSQYDLENNVLACDQTKFATERVVQDVDGYANLIVNHDPLNFNGYNGTGHPNFRVKYLLDYQFNPDSSKVKGARMMAVLKRSNSSDAVTPKLLGYRIKAL